MRNNFANIIYEQGLVNDKLCIVVADISPAGSIDKFRSKFPQRFINTGVAEQSMIGIAAGLAACGMKPFCYTIATFALYRPFEFIRVDLCYQNLPVVIVGMGAGLVYSTLGGTHHSIEDISIACSIPNMTVLAPCDPNELELLTDWCINNNSGPVYLRIGKSGEQILTNEAVSSFQFGKIRFIKKGENIAVISYGTILSIAKEVVDTLASFTINASLISVHTLKPLDNDGLKKVLSDYSKIIVIEEHVENGSLGTKIKALAHDISSNCSIKTYYLKDSFIHFYGSYIDLLNEYGINKTEIINNIINET
jgi:transketolase